VEEWEYYKRKIIKICSEIACVCAGVRGVRGVGGEIYCIHQNLPDIKQIRKLFKEKKLFANFFFFHGF
jgi:hypothetical protein